MGVNRTTWEEGLKTCSSISVNLQLWDVRYTGYHNIIHNEETCLDSSMSTLSLPPKTSLFSFLCISCLTTWLFVVWVSFLFSLFWLVHWCKLKPSCLTTRKEIQWRGVKHGIRLRWRGERDEKAMLCLIDWNNISTVISLLFNSSSHQCTVCLFLTCFVIRNTDYRQNMIFPPHLPFSVLAMLNVKSVMKKKKISCCLECESFNVKVIVYTCVPSSLVRE